MEMVNLEQQRGDLVLVVEDEALIRMMLVDVLDDAGFDVIEAENADAAVVMLNSFPNVQVVITDVRMPGSIDGLGLASWMRENRRSIPIVITSGFSTPPDIEVINPSIARLVAKPYNPDEVARCITDIIAQRLPE